MNAVEIIRQQARMCHKTTCGRCPVYACKPSNVFCAEYRMNNAEKVAELVEKWAKEHPEKKTKSKSEDSNVR